jgi:hypothetical protein
VQRRLGQAEVGDVEQRLGRDVRPGAGQGQVVAKSRYWVSSGGGVGIVPPTWRPVP